ncbi:MAG TPA: pyridoxamine 5'-phosphate oxidase family protein [Burkholderiales bacterium]|nr:pyridoxamine 5'-phosphate oxidase family protein [Burkholderiales bacterium]
MNLSVLARRHLRSHHHAVLGTLSLALPGYPFVSIVPYVLDERAWPVVLISRLAEHTRNVAADPRVSLFSHDAKGDVQAGARVTLMGNARMLERPNPIQERYFRYFPQARSYHDTLDFDFYRIEPVTLRVVAGFARVHWISREAYTVVVDRVARDEMSVIDYVNGHHSRDLQRYCTTIVGAPSPDVTLVGIDGEGFDMRAGEQIVRADFGAACSDASQAQQVIVALLTEAREGS